MAVESRPLGMFSKLWYIGRERGWEREGTSSADVIKGRLAGNVLGACVPEENDEMVILHITKDV